MGLLEDIAASQQALIARVDALTAELAAVREKVQPTRLVYTLRDLAELPESPSLHTLQNNPGRQPNGGAPDGYRGAAKAWRRETVEAWRRELAPRPDSGLSLVAVRATAAS